MFADRRNILRPKVLIVGLLPPPFGGVASMVEMQLRSCLSEEFDLHVVDISKRELRFTPEKPTWHSITYFLRDFGRLIRALILIRPVVVIVHAASSPSFLRDWIFMMLSRLSLAKVICHYHGTLHTRFPSCETSSGRQIGRLLMRAAHRIIVVGPTYQRRMGEVWHRSDIVWAPNVVDISLFSDGTLLQPVPWLIAGEHSVLFVGRLSAAKGIWDLLDAVPLVLQRSPKTKFVLVGVAENTARETDLRCEVERRGLKERIVFLGLLMGREKARAFLASDMLVVPSWTEAFPLVIPEAMAAGIPIIATEVGAIPDFVINGADGFLIPARNPSALADRICCLLNDDVLRTSIGKRVRHRAAAEFSIDVGCRLVAAVVRDLLSI
jgi:glycosyltransferase involved in cell wall biosynthesis